MKGQVLYVNNDFKIAGKYNGIQFAIENERGETKEYNVFQNADCANVVRTLRKGQWVEVSFEQKGKYKNVSGVTVMDGPPAPNPYFAATPMAKTAAANPDQFRSKEELRRSVALEVASRIVKPASVSPVELIKLATEFEQYLEKGVGNEVVADMLDKKEPF